MTLLGIAIPALAVAERMPIAVSDSPVDLQDTISLQEITVSTNFLNEKSAPINLTTIRPAEIRQYATARNYVEIMQNTPGVYATSSTGNYGDATLNMRGFKQENIAILLNGIPIQGLTSGSMYWNNWMGLGDATYAVQVQKGMGGSMLADCAMGGMVNIITRRGTPDPSMSFGLSTNEWGTTKTNFNYSSGMMDNGWSVDLSLAYVEGEGYVKCADVKTFSYMLNVSKVLNNHHTLMLTALGSPEEHDQRNVELTKSDIDTYGRDYSKNWGYKEGKPYSIARNHYAKPYFTLQHIMTGECLSMKNSIYLALADGGGRSTFSINDAIVNHRTEDGLINFDEIIAANKAAGASTNIMVDFLSGHTQAGGILSADYQFSDELKLSAGLQYQYYDTYQKIKVLDLLGGDCFKNFGGTFRVGDALPTSTYSRTTHHTSGYLQALYENEQLSANVGVALFNGHYMREDDVKHLQSEWASGWGSSVKAGILYRLTENQSVYANLGYNSRLPYASVYLKSSNLSITNDIVNEKNLMMEIGYRPRWSTGALEVSAYLAQWKDKTVQGDIKFRTNSEKQNYLMTGLNARHMGIEIAAEQQLNSWLSAKAFASIADWRWTSNCDASIYEKFTDDDLSKYTVYCKDLHVGDAPQSQYGAILNAKLPKGFSMHAVWRCNARMFANFEPDKRTNEADTHDAYRIPTYHLFDGSINWEHTFDQDVTLDVFVNGTNLTDTHYIERATDGKDHSLQSLTGYWGQARTLSVGMRLSF